MTKILLILLFAKCSSGIFDNGEKQAKQNSDRFLIATATRLNTKKNSSTSTAPEIVSGSECGGITTTNTATVGNNIYTTGYKQVTSINQDAFVKKVSSGTTIWNKSDYDTSPDDSRGEAIAADANNLFVAFSLTGGNSGLSSFVSSDAIQKSYGVGGGPKVSFIARINIDTGNITRGTFLGARLSSGKVNTLKPCSISITGPDEISFVGQTAFDNGTASDSLQPNVQCASGFIRRIKMNYQLNQILSITCDAN